MPARLNLNECPFPPPPKALEAVRKYASLLNRYYVEGLEEDVRAKVAKYVGLPEDYVVLLPGSEAFMVYSAEFLALNGLRLVAPKPSFEPAIKDYIVRGVEVLRVNLEEDLSLDPSKVLELAGEGSVLYVPNPNNPTGNLIVEESWLKEALEKYAYVFLDEAYYEFSDVTFAHLIKDYPNLVIIRTLSKAFAIAGARVGYVLGVPETLSKVLATKRLFEIPVTSLAAALGALEDLEVVRKYVKELTEVREWVVKELSRVENVYVRNSLTNFILVGVKGLSSKELKKELEKRGYLVRSLSDPLISKYVRVSIGTKEEMKEFVEVVKDVAESVKSM